MEDLTSISPEVQMPIRRKTFLMRPIVVFGIVVAAGTLALLGWSHFVYGSLGAGLASLNGESLWVEDASINLGEIVVDKEVQFTARVVNVGSNPVRLIGWRTSCSCTMVRGIPSSLEPRQSLSLQFQVRLSSRKDALAEQVVIFTDQPARREILFAVSATSTQDSRRESR